jgi:hypothetical protein
VLGDEQSAETPLAFASLLDALISLLGIFGIYLNPYVPSSKLFGGNSCCAGANKRVQNNIPHAREGQDQGQHGHHGLLGWVKAVSAVILVSGHISQSGL